MKLDKIVGPDKLIKKLRPVDGEDHSKLDLTEGVTPWKVVSASGVYGDIRRMKTKPNARAAFVSVAAILLLTGRLSQGAGADFVDIMAQFRCINRVQQGTNQYPQEWSHSVHCVVGTNLWFIEGNFSRNADISLLFTGTRVIEHMVLNEGFGAGKRWTNTWPSDGSLSRGAGAEKLAWLAFCSGPYLKQKVGVIPLPAPSGYFLNNVNHDRREVFKDELGLPSSVELFLPRDSPDGSRTLYWPSASYTVVESTNFLGWTFPISFEVKQSAGPGGGNGTGLYDGAELVITGHVTSIQPGRNPSIWMQGS